MTGVRERLSELRVDVASPDGTVRVRLDRERGVRTRIDPSASDRHDESSLAHQIETALTSAMGSYRHKVDDIVIGMSATGEAPDERSPLAVRQALMDDAMAEVTVTATSAMRYLRLEWSGESTFAVDVDRGAIARIGVDGLAKELNTALAAASRQRVPRLLAARRAALKNANRLR